MNLNTTNARNGKVEFDSKEEFDRFRREIEKPKKLKVISVVEGKNQVHLVVNDSEVGGMIAELANYSLNFLVEMKFTLEDYFMEFYDKNKPIKGGAVNVGN